MNRSFKTYLVAFALVLFGAATTAHASEDPIYTGLFNNKALKGYDTVSYFQGDGVPVKGSKEFKTEYKGANWYFASQENLDLFLADPEKYAPQYGGYCAWAAAKGTLAKGEPLVYDLYEGKLYLNYDRSIREKWAPLKEELIPVADKKFPELLDREY